VPPEPQREALPTVTWRALEAIPVLLIAIVGTAVLGGLASYVPSCGAQADLIVLAGELALGGSVLWWVTRIRKTSFRALGWPSQPVRDLVGGALVGLLLVVVAGVVLMVAQVVAREILGRTPAQPDQVPLCVQGVTLAFLGPLVILAAPLGEELFFRGFLYQGLRRRFSSWPAAMLSGVVFGLFHLGGAASAEEIESFLLIIPSLIAVGIGLALVFERRKSLLASMTAHAAFNAVGYVAIALSR
jgi:membrane protease YdiL (CAAX protease family)